MRSYIFLYLILTMEIKFVWMIIEEFISTVLKHVGIINKWDDTNIK